MYPNGIHSTCDTGAGIGFKLTPFGEGKEVKASILTVYKVTHKLENKFICMYLYLRAGIRALYMGE